MLNSISDSSFNRSMDLLKRGLAVNDLRGNIIANNIANADVPGFKRSEVNFEAELKRAIESSRYTPPLEGKVNGERHMAFHVKEDFRDVQPKVRLDYMTEGDADGNNIDPEAESISFVENQMRYEMMTRAVTHQFTMLNIAIRQN